MKTERAIPPVKAGVRVRLALLVAVATLPLLLLLLVTMREQADEARNRAHAELRALATVVAGRFHAWLQGSGQLVQSLALLPEVRELRVREVEPLFRQLVRPGSPLLNLGMGRPGGTVLVSSVPSIRPVDLSDRDYFQEALKSQGLASGELILGRLSGQPTLPLAAASLDARGTPTAVVFAGLDLTSLAASLDGERIPSNATLAFLDRAGRVLISRPRDHLSMDALHARIAAGERGPVEGQGSDGVLRVAAGAPLVDLRGGVVGHVVLSAPVRDVYGGSLDIESRGLLAVLLTGSVVFLLALFGGEMLLRRPLLNLCRTVSCLGAGELRARSGLADAPGVLGRLGRAFDRMAAHLEREILRSRLLLEAAGEGILGLDAQGRITFANGTAGRILRLEQDHLQGRLLHDLVHAEDESHTAVECPLLTPIRTNRPRNAVVDEFHCGDGTSLPVEWTGTPLEDPGGPTREVFLFSDISRRMGLERQLQHAMKMEVLGRLAASVAHDFNNVLTVLQGNSELMLSQGVAASESREAAEEIARACSRGKGLTERLLSMSRPRPQSRQVVDLNTLLRDFSRVMARLLGDDVEVLCRPHPTPAVVEVDVSQVEHWLLNLAANARDAMPGGGSLTLGTRLETISRGDAGIPLGQHVVLEVQDTGSGMEPEVLERAFEPFFTTKAEGKGTGLGLPTLRAQVQEHGGGLRVESAVGEGTRIAIYLPVSSGAAPVPGQDVGATPPTGRECILVVDDDASVRVLIARALRSAGYHVLEASRSERVPDEVRQAREPIDLLLTDMVMPGLSGPALWDAVRREPMGPRRVLFMSGYSPDRFEGDGADLGDGYLEKPFTLKQLLTVVRKRLDEPEA